MNLFKKTVVWLTAASMLTANSFGYMPFNLFELPAFTASAADIVDSGECGAEGNNLTWTLDSDGTLIISGKGDMLDWNYNSPWYENNKIKNVIIENGVTSIGNSAFIFCKSLTSVTIPDSVISIADNAFAFCEALTSITLPESITSIGNNAFVLCESLTSITLPDSIKSIGDYAFSSCTSLNSITIPDTIINFGAIPFNNTSWIETQRKKNPIVIVNGILIDGTTCKGDVIIPDGITSIGDGAFTKCSALTSVTISDSITSIGDTAFYSCDSLTSITIPKSVKSIGEWAFINCDSLNTVTIKNTECEIYDSKDTISNTAEIYGYNDSTAQAYAEKYSRKFVSLGEKPVITIVDSGECGADGDNLTWTLDSEGTLTISGKGKMKSWWSMYERSPWYENDKIKKLIIKNGVTGIGALSFSYCSSLTSVTCPSSITGIGNKAFCGCKSLTSITLPDSITSIGSDAFRQCYSLTSITIPKNVTIIEEGTFCGCKSLTSITIPDSVKRIKSDAFSTCSALTSIEIPNSITSIGDNAFYNCTSLNSITIPDSVTSIEDFTFYNCESLTSITIPDSVTNIGKQSFYNCRSLTSITIPERVSSIGAFAFDATPWLEAQREINPLVIVNGILIDGNACNGDVILPNSITSIGDGAFYNCTSLNSITISDSVTSIGNYVFSNCKLLTSITISDSVTSIGNNAFLDCEALNSITISESVTSIGNNAFSGSAWLEAQRKINPLVIVNGILIDGTTCTGDYIIPNGVTSIGGYAFYNCKSLTSIIIPNSVTSIGESAFFNCESLSSITIENPKCEIYYNTANAICNNYNKDTYEAIFNGTIYGYKDSSAQAYANYNNRQFELLYKFGDVNTDGYINAFDASLILAEYAALSTSGTPQFTAEQMKVADINDDGSINALDASLVLAYYAHTSTGGKDSLKDFINRQ